MTKSELDEIRRAYDRFYGVINDPVSTTFWGTASENSTGQLWSPVQRRLSGMS